uniref:Ig-like domain-containing protein n=1 Tax=Neovison vison TaxID=452646 RepID=A0A8C7BMK2_NEOVI
IGFYCLLFLFFFFPTGSSNADNIRQSSSVHEEEGKSVTLDCSFTLNFNYYVMYWYHQPPNGKMTEVISMFSDSSSNMEGRYTLSLLKRSRILKLTITGLMPADTGVYFCAIGENLHSFWNGLNCCDTNKLFFGKGTRLTVEARSQPPAKPFVFTMKNGSTVACLVKDFYPKEIDIKLEAPKTIVEFDPAIVVSPSGKYSAVKLGRYEDSNSVTCSVEHNNEIVRSTDFEPKKSPSDNVKPTEPGSMEQTSENLYGRKAGNVNMLSLTVLGLRMVFAKSLAINFLLTAKLFFF